MICQHQHLIRLSDEPYKPFLSYKAGFRYYYCRKCNAILKAMHTVAKPLPKLPSQA